jgi:hypothetical protein
MEPLDVSVPPGATAVHKSELHAPMLPRSKEPARTDFESSWMIDSVLFFVMGMSGWWTVNAIMWAESPIFVAETPEKQAIGNWLSVSCQVGNVFPFIYKGIFSKAQQAKILSWSILVCQALAIATGVVAAVGWKVQASLFGEQHSVVLILCTIVAGGVGTLSNVTYWAIATRYPGTHCTKAMSIGMTFSGMISAWCAIAQNAGSDPFFSAEIFLLGVAA